MNKLPLYRASISTNDADEVEVDYIALVEKPAIQSNFLAFDENKPRLMFAVTDEDEQVITGLAMIADEPIYRKDKQGEYFVYYDAAGINSIVKRFFRKGYNLNFNIDHDPNKQTEGGVYIFESYIVDRKRGKMPMEQFKDVADGSWIISAKIDSPEIWADVKAGKFKGFSVEGYFQMERIEYKEETPYSDEAFDKAVLEMLQASKK